MTISRTGRFISHLLTASYGAVICVLTHTDWRLQSTFPPACTVKVWIIGLYRSRTTWRWQEGITDE